MIVFLKLEMKKKTLWPKRTIMAVTAETADKAFFCLQLHKDEANGQYNGK